MYLDARRNLRHDHPPYWAFEAHLRLCNDGIGGIVPNAACCALRRRVWHRGRHRPEKCVHARYEAPCGTDALDTRTSCGLRLCSASSISAPPAVAAEVQPLLRGPEHQPVPCHNDLLPSNLLFDGDRVRIIDWEYAGMGDRYFDLANFAVNNELGDAGELALLEAYFAERPTARQVATLRLMKFMSDFREAMWGVVQTVLSELDFDFEGYAGKHFERMLETAGHRDFETWLSEAREPTS